MTGFGHGTATGTKGIVTAEIKTVNNRFLELNIRTDHFSAAAEESIKSLIKEEELTRFESHLNQFAAALDSTEPIGRKLDFLLQEINREINTTASKANDISVIDCVIIIKTELEKIREQVQNIE